MKFAGGGEHLLFEVREEFLPVVRVFLGANGSPFSLEGT